MFYGGRSYQKKSREGPFARFPHVLSHSTVIPYGEFMAAKVAKLKFKSKTDTMFVRIDVMSELLSEVG